MFSLDNDDDDLEWGVNDFQAANIKLKIIESHLKIDKNESSWTFNQRLVSAKRIKTQPWLSSPALTC